MDILWHSGGLLYFSLQCEEEKIIKSLMPVMGIFKEHSWCPKGMSKSSHQRN